MCYVCIVPDIVPDTVRHVTLVITKEILIACTKHWGNPNFFYKLVRVLIETLGFYVYIFSDTIMHDLSGIDVST